jgi:hypothetical protein
MASSSSFVPPAVYTLGYPVTEKLARNNFPLWKAHVLLAIKRAQVAHYLDKNTPVPPESIPSAKDKPYDLVPNPEYAA